jgi:hypothetical protein
MTDARPGLNSRRLGRLIRAAIERCELDLRGATVLTEAATGAYVVTPVLAATAGAEQVFAVTRESRHGTMKQVTEQTGQLAELAGVGDRIQIITDKSQDIVSQADIVTNSGYVRPIDAAMISSMKKTAVISLMYEAWEFRARDIDLASCHQHGIPVAGTNERHPAVDVFAFLGAIAAKLCLDAGIAVHGSHILVLCDNPFNSFIEQGLSSMGASIDVAETLSAAAEARAYDVILVALRPRPEPVISVLEATKIADCWPGAVVAQFWGDVNRSALLAADVPFWPRETPPLGHMGVLPSDVGPDPIVRLQAGGLKVGELLWRARSAGESVGGALALVEHSNFGKRVRLKETMEA